MSLFNSAIFFFMNCRKYTREKECRFLRASFFDEKCSFEGYNTIYKRTRLYSTSMGIFSYVSNDSSLSNVKIGRFSCIGPYVRNLIGEHPTSKIASIHPVFFSIQNKLSRSFVTKQKFVEVQYIDGDYCNLIGNDVWIGGNVTILPGVSIHDGAIVAAGSVVVNDVPPYSIVAGVPAKVVKYRFTQEQIDFLLQMKWWEKDIKWLKEKADLFDDIERLMKEIEE